MTQDEHAGKRRKLNVTDHAQYAYDQARLTAPKIQLSCNDYTIGWICALPVELAAAKAVLDIEHALPIIPMDDKNMYSLGSIFGHNIAITCLPIGCYGTTPAAVVAEHMMFTFGSIKTVLMVGIGGGAPRPGYDIRLGDVVISTPTSEHPAVIQYDFGKTGVHGISESKGTLNKPKPHLLRAIALMKASHQSRSSKVSEYISSALDHLSLESQSYAYPGVDSDILFRLDGEQEQRIPRSDTRPMIYYGTIASGNQVIKDASTRDYLAVKLNALCFEMEAAGLMDEHQCLIIRGISDYCDAYKKKDFQGYAAIAAAAVAKELLSIIPPKERTTPLGPVQPNSQVMNHRRAVLELLDFEESDSRRATVKKAHTQTCEWLTEQPEYLDWLDSEKFNEYHGLLWLRGKPGTGKSTIMKFILEQQMQERRDTNLVVISFFFNARGHDLEKSIVGMYRSLLHQLLKKVPEMQVLLDDLRLNAVSLMTSEYLESLLARALNLLGSRRLICLVDALDECPEDQIRKMVQFFEEIGELTCSQNLLLHVLFASRHYPNISIEKGQVLVLEEQDGHSQDLVKYINAELKIGKHKQLDEIKEELLRKSNKIFLWVILVVRILKTEYDKGRIQGLAKKLQEIPPELDTLFSDILTRDGQHLPELVLCMQWILYAARPLRREEFYFALLAGNDSEDIPLWDPENVTVDVMDNLLLDTSKGLVEMTRSKKPTVQFIHESIREFLLRPRALADLHHVFQGLAVGQAHQRLRECCEKQICSSTVARRDLPKRLPASRSSEAAEFRIQTYNSIPFLGYAVEFVVYHANSADRAGVSQLCYTKTFLDSPWLKWNNLLQKLESRRIIATVESSLISFLALRNLERLLALRLQQYPDSSRLVENALKVLSKTRNLSERARLKAYVLLCKTLHKCSDVIEDEHENFVEPLIDFVIESGLSDRLTRLSQELFTVLLRWHQPPSQHTLDQTLRFAAIVGHEKSVVLLCSKGADVNSRGSGGHTPLLYAAWYGHTAMVKLLCSKGADIDARDTGGYTPFLFAARNGHQVIVDLLYNKGAYFDAKNSEGCTPLSYAARYGHTAIVECLCSIGADVNSQGNDGRTPLSYAARNGHKVTIELLYSKGAIIDSQDTYGETPLSYAYKNKHKAVVKLLRSKGATIDDKLRMREHRSHS